MKHLFFSVIAVLMSAFVASCSDDEDSVVSKLSSDKTEVTFSSERSVESVLVSATADWNIITDVSDWLHLTKTSYKAQENRIAFILDANPSEDARVGHIVVTSGDKKLLFTITQEGSVVVKLSQEYYYVNNAGGQLNIRISTNVNLDVTVESDDDWLTFDQLKTDTQFPVLQFTATENDTESERTAIVTVKAADSDVSQTLAIVQKEKDIFEVIDGETREVPGNETSTISFTIEENIDFVEFVSDRSWITAHVDEEIPPVTTKDKDANAVIEQILKYDVIENPNYEERVGTILLTDAATGDELVRMTITQAGNPKLELGSTSLTKDKDKYSADAVNKLYWVELNTNVENISVSSSADWITYEKSVGGYTLKIESNPGQSTRDATVTFSDENGKATPLVMNITQKKP